MIYSSSSHKGNSVILWVRTLLMISDNLAIPLAKVATHAFSKMVDPSKLSIQRIFVAYWASFLLDPEVVHRGLRPVIVKEVQKMMACGTLDSGFEIYECPNCKKTHVICYTCKSRFCNTCGVKYASLRAHSISASTLDVPHRHVVFTIDHCLRDYFRRDRALLHVLFEAVKDTLFYTFDRMNGKKHTFKPGFILTLHTFGRALNWNPHIHCLLTEGGMNEDQIYKPISYINYEVLRKSFMKCLLDKMKAFYANQPAVLSELKLRINQIYRDYADGFYVHAPAMEQKNGKDAVTAYIIRYAGRPVMAQSRILELNRSTQMITYFYEDHKTKERIEVTEPVFTFMKKLIVHIPESQFKMIRYYGLYASCQTQHKPTVKALLKLTISTLRKHLPYRQSLISTFDTDPLRCDCGHYMEYIGFWVPPSKRNGGFAYDSS